MGEHFNPLPTATVDSLYNFRFPVAGRASVHIKLNFKKPENQKWDDNFLGNKAASDIEKARFLDFVDFNILLCEYISWRVMIVKVGLVHGLINYILRHQS